MTGFVEMLGGGGLAVVVAILAYGGLRLWRVGQEFSERDRDFAASVELFAASELHKARTASHSGRQDQGPA